MASRFEKLPTEEDLVGAGMPFGEATSFLGYVTEKKWSPDRVWGYLLKKQTAGFPKLSLDELSQHFREKDGAKVDVHKIGMP